MNELDVLKIEQELRKNYVLSENTKLFNIYKNENYSNLLSFLIKDVPISSIAMGIITHNFVF